MTSLVVILVSKQSSKFRDYITCREVEGFIELSWRVMTNATTDSKYNKCNFKNTYFYVSYKNCGYLITRPLILPRTKK